VRNENNVNEMTAGGGVFVGPDLAVPSAEGRTAENVRGAFPWIPLARLGCFFGLLIGAMFVVNAMISTGLRRIKTSAFGAENLIMEGKVNADVVIAGSSRALAHYDPRTLASVTGKTAFNVGRNGAQTDMQIAFLNAYLEHNRMPGVVIFNLDAFSFVTSTHVFDSVEYMPYIQDPVLYNALKVINPNIWKSRYMPLYGYVVEDMNMTWIQGLKGFLGIYPKEDFYLGFNPRSKKWTNEFENLKESQPEGVSFEIEPAGIQDIQDLIQECQRSGIQLIFVYSPEYREMQSLTTNREEIFAKFREISARYDVPFWDYSDWRYAGNTEYFQNSQHLNAEGAAVFSDDVARRLKQFLQAPNSANVSSRGGEDGSRVATH